MPKFFVQDFDKDCPKICGADASHIIKSLRMKIGEELTVCDTKGSDYICKISEISDIVRLKVMNCLTSCSEPSVKVTLFQCVPKGDKLESVIQKSVEMGVFEIVPVLSSRCVSRPDAKAAAKKHARYQKIANSAAGQSGRGILPQVGEMISFSQLEKSLDDFDKSLIFYECGGRSLCDTVDKQLGKIAIIIGPEGGFDKAEVERVMALGAVPIGLGARILRTETAPIAALSAIMLLTGNLQ